MVCCLFRLRNWLMSGFALVDKVHIGPDFLSCFTIRSAILIAMIRSMVPSRKRVFAYLGQNDGPHESKTAVL